MKDLANRLHSTLAIAPQAVAANGAVNSAIIDRAGYDSLAFIIATGAMGTAGAFAVSLTEGNDPALADGSAVAASDMGGTSVASAAFDFSVASKTRKIGYAGSKRYVRLTLTLSANTGTQNVSAVAVQGDAVNAPPPNPPQ